MKQHKYTPYYCEENIYNLVKDCITQKQDHLVQYYAIVLTNPFQQTYIRCQKLQPLVIWDYHVIMIAKHTQQKEGKIIQWSNVFDFDSALSWEVNFQEYFSKAISFKKPQPTFFRICEGKHYLENFASDRHHMLKNGKYLQPPPNYPCIQNKCLNNLQSYLDLSDQSFGKWLNEEEFYKFFIDKCV